MCSEAVGWGVGGKRVAWWRKLPVDALQTHGNASSNICTSWTGTHAWERTHAQARLHALAGANKSTFLRYLCKSKTKGFNAPPPSPRQNKTGTAAPLCYKSWWGEGGVEEEEEVEVGGLIQSLAGDDQGQTFKYSPACPMIALDIL